MTKNKSNKANKKLETVNENYMAIGMSLGMSLGMGIGSTIKKNNKK